MTGLTLWFVTTYYYDRHPPAFPLNRRAPRRSPLSGVIGVHTAEGAPDFTPPDTGAENVASFLADRTTPGSYHRVVDSDSIVAMMEWDAEAAGDRTGTNAHAIHLSVATQAHLWPTKPKWWRDGAINNLAMTSTDAAQHLNVVRGRKFIPPAKRISGDEARAKTPGFVAHGDLDPGRRSDPGAGFPWDQFLSVYAFFVASVLGASTTQGVIPAPSYQVPLQLTPRDQGVGVARLQSIVRFWMMPELAVDGIFGDVTAEAVQAFKGSIRSTVPDPATIGNTPLWGFDTERGYGRFLSAVESL